MDQQIFNIVDIFYSEYKNKLDYLNLIGSHIVKAIIAFAGDNLYTSKIFIDKMDKRAILNLSKEIKSFHIRYKKIRSLIEETSPFIRFADALCGMLRDLDNKEFPKSYKIFFSKIKEV